MMRAEPGCVFCYGQKTRAVLSNTIASDVSAERVRERRARRYGESGQFGGERLFERAREPVKHLVKGLDVRHR